jgi:hypothetical protein
VAEVRLFVADTPGGRWIELTNGDQRTVRIAAPDLQDARRARARIRDGGVDVAVILDVAVAVASDFRAARATFGRVGEPATVEYAGTVDGLAGLIADIYAADVADGVTLIPASPRQDLRTVGLDVLDWLAIRGHARAS